MSIALEMTLQMFMFGWQMNMEPLLAASRATDEFKDSVREYSTHGKAPLVEAAGFAPPIKVMRVLAQLLDAEPALQLERVRIDGYAGCSDFRGAVEAHADGVVRQWHFVWCCKWRAVEEGWVDCFGFPDQMRAAREFGYRCFATWLEAPRPEASASKSSSSQELAQHGAGAR